MELKEFIENSINNKDYRVFQIGKATPQYAFNIKRHTGIDISDYDIVIDSNAIRHTIKNMENQKHQKKLV